MVVLPDMLLMPEAPLVLSDAPDVLCWMVSAAVLDAPLVLLSPEVPLEPAAKAVPPSPIREIRIAIRNFFIDASIEIRKTFPAYPGSRVRQTSTRGFAPQGTLKLHLMRTHSSAARFLEMAQTPGAKPVDRWRAHAV